MNLEIIQFSINPSSKDEINVEKLKELLAQLHVKVKLNDSHCNGEDFRFLLFSYDADEVDKIKSRGAGRKYARCNMSLTLDDVENMIKELGAENAAHQLGMTKQGMYARIRRRKKQEVDFF